MPRLTLEMPEIFTGEALVAQSRIEFLLGEHWERIKGFLPIETYLQCMCQYGQ